MAALAYLADPHTQRFELWLPEAFHLSSLSTNPLSGLPLFAHHHLADFSWSLLAAMVVRQCWPLRQRVLQAGVLVAAATSWEWLQFVGLAPGVFDVIDVAVGILAASLVMLVRPQDDLPGDSQCP